MNYVLLCKMTRVLLFQNKANVSINIYMFIAQHSLSHIFVGVFSSASTKLQFPFMIVLAYIYF